MKILITTFCCISGGANNTDDVVGWVIGAVVGVLVVAVVVALIVKGRCKKCSTATHQKSKEVNNT